MRERTEAGAGGAAATEQHDERPPWGVRARFAVIPLAVIAALLLPVFVITVNSETSYPFIKASHPIDVGISGGGRWFYYMPDAVGMTPPLLAAEARTNLLPRGFVEDVTTRPWFRFVKGGREVIVCNHDEIATAPTSWVGWRVFHGKLPPNTPRGNWPVVWVREPTPDPAGLLRFKLQKLVFRW